MLDFIDETLCQMTLLVPVFVILPALFPVLPRWNNDFGLNLVDHLDKLLGIIRTIGDQAFKIKLSDQVCCLRDVMPLSTRQTKTQRISQSIHAYMDFGGEAAATAAKGLFGLPAAFFVAPAAQG